MSEKDLPIDISKDSSYSSIFQSNIDSKILLSLSDFFQYQMANTSDSPLSLKIDSNSLMQVSLECCFWKTSPKRIIVDLH